MHITERGILSPGHAGTHHTCVTFPSTTVLSDGSSSPVAQVHQRISDDETMSAARATAGAPGASRAFASMLNGRRCSMKAGITALGKTG
jgi:hypothetical protein